MKTDTIKPRVLTPKSIAGMRRGGRNASREDKRKAGRLGWEAMIRTQAKLLDQTKPNQNLCK